jgi:hypothetical protein
MTALADPVDEARRIIEAANAAGLVTRTVGGVGVAIVAPTIRGLEPPRTYHDIDLAAPAGSAAIARVMTSLGYEAARRFNTLNGSERLLFHDPDGRRVDVFIDTLRMCHELPFRDRLAVDAWPWTLPPADLLLSKLQIVEQTDRDAQDVLALLADHELAEDDRDGIALPRIRAVCGSDWGWWRTVDDNLQGLISRWAASAAADASGPVTAADASATSAASARARDRAVTLRAELASSPKSMGWRARAAIGPRMRWYDLPEEVR